MQQQIVKMMGEWGVSKEDIGLYSQMIETRNFPKGVKFAGNQNECRGLVLIEYGALRAYIISPIGKEINLFILQEGDYCVLSVSCVLQNITFEVNLEFIETSSVVILPSKTFNQLSEKYPKAKQFHLDLVSQRLSRVVESLGSLAFDTLQTRIMNFLNKISQTHNKKTLYITHEEIANALGSAREAVSRVLKDLEKQNKIILKRGIIEVLEED